MAKCQLPGRGDTTTSFAVWGNSTLGLLSHWWHSNRQQSSKAGMTIRSAGSLSILDFRALTDEQLRTAKAIFHDMKDKELKPAYLADADPNRAHLDRRVVCDLLGFDEATYEAVRRLVRQVVRRTISPRRQGCGRRVLCSSALM